MTSASTRSTGQKVQAELALVPLRNCLVNLPTSLETLLVNANIPAQNVIIELNYKPPQPSASSSVDSNRTSHSTSIFVGWTGMPSKRKLAPIVSRDGISGSRGNASFRDQELPLVEIDATFARTLGLSDGQKVTAILHLDPPLAHTVNIEPQTPADWEIIELHATFLELNFLSQIRALPNPLYTSANGVSLAPHPLTLHLSPTSTANILVTALSPPPPSSTAFSKIAPDAEVIVAPKARPRSARSAAGRENRSVTSRRSAGGRSGASTVRQKKLGESQLAMFFRCLDRSVCGQWFDEGELDTSQELAVWIDRDIINSKKLRGVSWVCVTLIKPAAAEVSLDPQKQQQEIDAANGQGKPTSRIVARLKAWDDPPDSRHIALSTALTASLGSVGIVGGVVKVEPAPQPVAKDVVQKIKIYPFVSNSSKLSEGLRFGGESKADREQAESRILNMYGKQPSGDGLLDGPITDGLVLTTSGDHNHNGGWEGGLLRFELSSSHADSKENVNWLYGKERKLALEVQPSIPKPPSLTAETTIGEPLPRVKPVLVGIDPLISQLQTHLSHMSSVLLTGALGSGKTSVAHHLAHRFRSEFLFHVSYFPCRKLVTDETRISTIKETLTKLFMEAAWGARLGGQSLVILDDLDKLCPVETELQVGGENGRSRQVSEGVCSIVRQFCSKDSGIVLLASAQAKEALNNVIIGGHVVREIVGLKAPDKEGRRKVLEMVVGSSNAGEISRPHTANHESRPSTAGGEGNSEDEAAWMDGASSHGRRRTSHDAEGFVVDRDVDFLDLAGQSDGFMPGDLVLLVSRARSEALIRSVSESSQSSDFTNIQLSKVDFEKALKGFTPASLRNVTLQTSTTTFDSIGGLQETRRILLETLQYPTTYAPIFAQCPLRLRSGLLLYGYPGCGKTLLASAVAGECGLNFISVKGPEILNKYIGASEKSVRDLFERAEAARPCVLFFDEFDSIAPKRGHDSTGVTDRVVNQLLTQMDGAEGLSGVYVLAATSRPDLIDPALLRPGRLDKSLICDLPNLEDRTDILRAVSKKLKLSTEVQNNLVEIARRTEGYSGADLQALVYNAQLDAIHDVLGDHDPTTKRPNGSASTVGAAKSNGRLPASKQPSFIQFRYGSQEEIDDADSRSRAGHSRSALLAERANIVAKLEAIKLAKRKQKLARRGQSQLPGADHENGKGGELNGEGTEKQEVTVEWKHIVKSLGSTKASLSTDERRRLERIYREFVVGRNGEMPNGQGPTEVGGRSSLM